MTSTQKVCPKCKDQTDGRPTPHTVKDGKWKCGLCGHETSKKTYNTKKSKMLDDMINKFNEAKDDKEYGYEGEMAMSQLKGIISHAKQLHDMLEPDTDLPEWVQSKLTLAYDYMQTVTDYMSTELDEDAAPTNNAGGGKIAGMGVGPQGEPGVTPKAMQRYKKKNNPILQPVNKRKSLSDFVRGN